MNVFMDIETIPSQKEGVKEKFIKDSIENFKAPSALTKTKAATDLGMIAADAKFIGKDDMMIKWAKQFAPLRAEEAGIENWKKTSFDGAQGELFSIAWAVGDGDVVGFYREPGASEYLLLSKFFKGVTDEIGKLKPFFIGNYIGGFDLKFLFKRAVILGVKPPFALPHFGRHDQHFYDLQQAWEGFGGRASLDSMCRALCIPGKPDDIDGSKVWQFVEAGEYQKVMDYNKLDVEEARAVYNRLTFR